MAPRYFVIGGTDNNWSSTTNWSTSSGGAGGSSVPTASDDVIFDGNSPDCTIDIGANKSARTLDCANYTKTLTFNGNLSVSGNIILGASMSFAGFSALNMAATGTFTSNGKIVGVSFAYTGNTGTITLADPLVISGNATLGAPSGLTVNGYSVTVGGNLTMVGLLTGTTSVTLNGTGTWSGSWGGSSAGTGVYVNLTINTGGTITVSGAVNFLGALTHTAGTVVTTGSTLELRGPSTLKVSNIIWDNITIVGNSTTITLLGDLTLRGLLTSSTGSVITINGYTIYASGGLTIVWSITRGTTNIVLNGTGTWSGSGVLKNNLTINTNGTITVSGKVRYDTGTLTYTTGTVVTTGSTLVVAAPATLNTNGIIWDAAILSGGSIGLTSAFTVE
jgi:hypothetical protein